MTESSTPSGQSPDNKPLAYFNKTDIAKGRLAKSAFYEEPDEESFNGHFQGRPVIGRDTAINGGVYVGARGREAVVVDDTTQPHLNQVYAEMQQRQTAKTRGQPFKSGILETVYGIALEKIPYDSKRTEEYLKTFLPDKKVALSQFIILKAGVCRHQALFVAYLLERLAKEGFIQGRASIDRNYAAGRGGHAWVRYTNSRGIVFIIDPAKHYIGKLSETPEDKWFYERPEAQPAPPKKWKWPWSR